MLESGEEELVSQEGGDWPGLAGCEACQTRPARTHGHTDTVNILTWYESLPYYGSFIIICGCLFFLLWLVFTDVRVVEALLAVQGAQQPLDGEGGGRLAGAPHPLSFTVATRQFSISTFQDSVPSFFHIALTLRCHKYTAQHSRHSKSPCRSKYPCGYQAIHRKDQLESSNAIKTQQNAKGKKCAY